LLKGYLPVKTAALEGPLTGDAQYADPNIAACLARASIFGVLRKGCPMKPKYSALCWSVIINRILGFIGSFAFALIAVATTVTPVKAVNSFVFIVGLQ
jgi:hypothetical protein